VQRRVLGVAGGLLVATLGPAGCSGDGGDDDTPAADADTGGRAEDRAEAGTGSASGDGAEGTTATTTSTR
jgi:hypothetical protein